jgi:8-oxo-dGTP pyrophosphatase MutT (NUDIX family)
MHSSLIHVIARAVVIIDDLVLLAHCKGASNTFLPGGHIEYGETAIAAVKREVIEEFKLRLVPHNI